MSLVIWQMTDRWSLPFLTAASTLTYEIVGPIVATTNNGTFSNLPPGNYNYTITDSLGCFIDGNFVINPGVQLNLNTNIVDPACADNNGEMEIFVFGGSNYQYSIDSGQTFTSTNVFTQLSSGQYNVVVLDVSGCSLDTMINLNNQTAQQIVNVVSDSVTCNGGADGSLEVMTNGGTGNIFYSIDNGSTTQNTPIFNNLTAGVYNIWTQDENGCLALQTVNVYEPLIIQAQFNVEEPLCNGDCNGQITINPITGGNGGYITEINNNQGTAPHYFK